MKKRVDFPVFGSETDYLELTIKDLVAMEAIATKSIISIWNDLINSNYSLTMIYKLLPVAYEACAREKGGKVDIDRLIEQAIDNGASIGSFALPLATAITMTGIFGLKQEKN